MKFILVVLVALAACSAVTEPTPTVNAQQLVGTWLEQGPDSATLVFTADGRVVTQSHSGVFHTLQTSGTWTFAGAQLCLSYAFCTHAEFTTVDRLVLTTGDYQVVLARVP